MAKAPKPGAVKTRLAPDLPALAVTSLYRCLLEDTMTLAKSLDGVEVAVMCPDADRDEVACFLGDTAHVVAQRGEGLAAGLTSVFAHFTAPAPRPVVAFNTDSPHLSPSILDSAFQSLVTCDVVVGPTHDGGYYLIGAKAAHPALFAEDGMGTKSALDRLVARAKALGLSIAFTEPFYDVDVAADLIRLARELQSAPARAPRTAAWLVEWNSDVARMRRSLEER